MRIALLAGLFACGGSSAPPEVTRTPPTTIRVAVIGGMMDTGFWPELVTRFERSTGHTIELAATGPKTQVLAAFKRGGIDVIIVHACDAMVNLVADGLAEDPQPWTRNDIAIVGPKADPAGIRGERDAVVALKKLIAAKAPVIVHGSYGADGVLHDLLEDNGLHLDPAQTIHFQGENQRAVVKQAAEIGGYTLVGRIPMLTGKLKAEGIEILVKGDPRLRRPYLVQTSTQAGPAARELAGWLRSKATQAFITSFGIGTYDDAPLFFPVAVR
jgi:tungstate transport system substrate-binding protein